MKTFKNAIKEYLDARDYCGESHVENENKKLQTLETTIRAIIREELEENSTIKDQP